MLCVCSRRPMTYTLTLNLTDKLCCPNILATASSYVFVFEIVLNILQQCSRKMHYFRLPFTCY